MFFLSLQLSRVQNTTEHLSPDLGGPVRFDIDDQVQHCWRLALFSMALGPKAWRISDILLREISSAKEFSTPAMWEAITWNENLASKKNKLRSKCIEIHYYVLNYVWTLLNLIVVYFQWTFNKHSKRFGPWTFISWNWTHTVHNYA